MKTKHTKFLNLILWILSLILIGSLIGSSTKPEINNWYSTLNRSALTPPNFVFPIAWTILYAMIGACGWLIWSAKPSAAIKRIQKLYIIQLILNWCWTPLFFTYHLTGLALAVLLAMDFLVATLIWLSYPHLKSVSLLMLPYLLWILFASYLNFYIWSHLSV